MWFDFFSRRSQPVRRQPASCRLTVEALESRDLPSNFTLGTLTQVSGPSPFNGDPNQPALYRNAETEPFVGVDPTSLNDPTKPYHAVAVWFQDLADGIVSAATIDGGANWQEAVVPGLTLCSGGTYPTAADPWLSFEPNGDAYLMSIENHAFEHNHGNAIRVNKSTDGGQTWSAPTTLIENLSSGFNFDKPSITADPGNANYVYAVWNRSDQGNRGSGSQTFFTRTTDAGLTWEAARVICTPGNDDFTLGDQIVVRPDGTLLDFFTEQLQHGQDEEFRLSVFRSTDRGVTWSAPIQVAEMLGLVVTDPETGQLVTTDSEPPGPLFDVVQDPTSGNLYTVWEDARFSGGAHNGIAFSMSTDGGSTWSAPVAINKTPTDIASGNQNAFLPSIAVAADGTVGVTYYDFRNNTPAAGLLTDYWFVHADPGMDLTNPANWGQELRLTNTSFDMETAPLGPHGLFVGDYEGLAAAGTDFVPTWAMPHGTDVASVFSRRIIAGSPLEPATVGHNLAAPTLTSQQVSSILPEAIHRWQAAGVDTSGVGIIQIQITDLGGATLSLASGHTTWLDAKAAGWGWFVDPTPQNDSEFTTSGDQGEQDRMDLLTVLEHEIDLLLGCDHAEKGLMRDTLAAGVRETPIAVVDQPFVGL
jgi:hypothetical protein